MSDYQLMPPLSDEEYIALKADIAARGVLAPIEYDERGNLLDGHHRTRACGVCWRIVDGLTQRFLLLSEQHNRQCLKRWNTLQAPGQQ